MLLQKKSVKKPVGGTYVRIGHGYRTSANYIGPFSTNSLISMQKTNRYFAGDLAKNPCCGVVEAQHFPGATICVFADPAPAM
jgi:hypothetical protein